MPASTLIALVGNDTSRLEELITIVAGIVLACLIERHKEEAENGSV